MRAIALCDIKGGIAKDGKQITFIPEDTRNFRRLTIGHPVIMGRKTYEALPNKEPLPNRRNIILSRTIEQTPNGFELYNNEQDLLGHLTVFDRATAWVIGGAEIYWLFLPWCNDLVITRIMTDYQADRFFPAFNAKCEFYELERPQLGVSTYHDGHLWHIEHWVRKGAESG